MPSFLSTRYLSAFVALFAFVFPGAFASEPRGAAGDLHANRQLALVAMPFIPEKSVDDGGEAKLDRKQKMKETGLFPTYPTPDYTKADRRLIDKGEYLVKIGDCISCHSDTPEGGAPFSGGLPLKTPFGTFYTPNITPDLETGIGKWTDEQFIRAMRDGLTPEGKHYFPAFPYVYFNKVTTQDLLAIKAYLFSIPAVKKENKGNTLPFPLNWRFTQLGWKLLFFYPYRGQFQYDPSRSSEWNRGAYLVEGLGHCGMCHTPMNPLGAAKRSQHLTGAFIDGFWAPNITNLGLHGATIAEVEHVFKKDELLQGAGQVTGPMAEVNHNSLNYLHDEDLRAIIVYLHSVENKTTNYALKLAKEKYSGAGKKVFYDKCAACHGKGAVGAPVIGDSSNWVERYKKGMDVMYRHTINGYNSMPIMGNCLTCSEQEIRSAVNYLVAHSLTPTQKRLAVAEPPRKLTLADGKKIYQGHCASCHKTGKDGAPKLGLKDDWSPRIQRGVTALMFYSLEGHDGKHVKGGCDTCSNAEVIAAVKYMLQEAEPNIDLSLW